MKIIKSKNNNVILSGYVWHKPKGFHKAHKMMINNKINEKNLWKKFKKMNYKAGWLLLLNFSKNDSVKENIKIEIDGNDFHNLDEFYCLIGEEVNGAGGYFGRQINALSDCLSGNFGVKSVEELVWNNHTRSKKIFKTKFAEIIQVFKNHNVKVTLN